MKTRSSLAALAAAGIATTVTALAAGSGTAAAPAFHSVTYVAHEVPGEFAMADIAEPHGDMPSIGDVLAFTNALTRDGHAAGRVSNVAVGVDARRHLFQADGTVILGDGRVEYAGLVSQGDHFTLAVTGGTGRYVGASGTLAFRNVHGRQLLTLRVDR
jgi:hypothetical protein